MSENSSNHLGEPKQLTLFVADAQYMLFKRVIKYHNSHSSISGSRYPTIITTNYTLDEIKTMENKKNQGNSPLSSRINAFVQVQLYSTDLPDFREEK